MALNRLFQALAQQQGAQPAPLPPMGTVQQSPAAFQASNLPWQQQIGNAIDWNKAGGDAWNAIGRDGVIGYMGDALQKQYGTNDLSKFRYIENKDAPGGYVLDWEGRNNAPGGFVNALRLGAHTAGIGYNEDGSIKAGNAAENLPFGVTWEGEGGTNFNLFRKPDGSVGIQTGGQKSNDTADALMAAAVVGGGMLGGQFLGGMTGGAGAAGAAGGSGAFLGEGALSGVGAWDAALAGAPSWTAAGAAGAGMTDLGGGLGIGADGSITGSTMAGGGTLSNAGIESMIGGSAYAPAAGAAGLPGGGGAGGAGGGTPPPPNPYNIGSYANPTNLGNLAKSAMGEFTWSSLIGPALNLGGQLYAGSKASDAAEQQAAAAREAAAMFKPWIDNGAYSINQAGTMLGRNGPEAAKAAFQMDPGYQFRLDQGNKALERTAAARGLLGSGKYLKDAMAYNQGQASQEFGSSLNRLLAVAGMGQTATGSGAEYGTQAANANAAGSMAKANALTNGITQGYSMYNNNQIMNRLFPGYA